MMDVFLRAHLPEPRLELAVAVTTQLCREASAQHQLSGASQLALSRLLTSVSLLGLTSRAQGTTSLQLTGRGKLGGVYADVNEAGHLRGFVNGPSLPLPLPRPPDADGRYEIGSLTLPGELFHLVKTDASGHRSSSVRMMSGELDEDVSHLLTQSEQRAATLRAEVLLNDDGQVWRAAGVYVHALPDGDLDALADLTASLNGGELARRLQTNPDAEGLLAKLALGPAHTEPPLPLQLRCRCSLQRVVRSLQLLDLSDLMDIVNQQEVVQAGCQFCGETYNVPPEEAQRLLEQLIRAQA